MDWKPTLSRRRYWMWVRNARYLWNGELAAIRGLFITDVDIDWRNWRCLRAEHYTTEGETTRDGRLPILLRSQGKVGDLDRRTCRQDCEFPPIQKIGTKWPKLSFVDKVWSFPSSLLAQATIICNKTTRERPMVADFRQAVDSQFSEL
jgi:hypothetical protein